jgi:hypothetical protein
MKDKEKKYTRISKDMTPDSVEGMLNDKFNKGLSIVYYDERIMSTQNVWVTVVFEKINKLIV